MRKFLSVALMLCATLTAGCRSESADTHSESAAAPAEPGVMYVKAEDFAFTGPPTIPSGWTKLRFDNQGAETHFILLVELPEGVTFDDYAADVARPFNDFYKKYRSGEIDQATFFEQLGGAVPEWIFTARRTAGAGFTAPGHTSETTFHLDPGNYVMECYVRTMAEDDTFHNNKGMLRPLIVTEDDSGLEPPRADATITLTNYAMTVDGDLSAGKRVVHVRSQENPEGLVFHNAQLARLEGDVAVADVAAWMNWVDELVPPAPAVFLGGSGQLSAGLESYVTVELEPGRYAWISEFWGPQGMVHEFTVE